MALHRGVPGQSAEVAFAKALSIDPGNGNARYYLVNLTVGKASRALSWDEPEQAIALLRKALRAVPDEPKLIRKLAQAIQYRVELNGPEGETSSMPPD